MKQAMNKAVLLLSPLSAFAILLFPYNWANRRFIVKWLGCGCPIIEGSGGMVDQYFNANDFTRLFWLFVTLCVMVTSIFLSKRLLGHKPWLRVLYIIGMLPISLFLSVQCIFTMLWC